MILRLRAGSETLILGPRAAFAAVAGRDRGALLSEYEVRRRLRIALADPETADALRRAFARWREEGARIREADDRALIDRVARMSRNGSLAAFVVADRSKGLASSAAAAPPARPVSAAGPPDSARLAGVGLKERIAMTLGLVPNHLSGATKQEFAKLVEPQALETTVEVLAIWAVSHAFGAGEAIDAVLLAAGLYFGGAQLWGGLHALFHALELVATAQSVKQLDEAAAIFADGVAKLGIAVLIAALTRGVAKKAARWTEKKPGLRNTPQEKVPKAERYEPRPSPKARSASPAEEGAAGAKGASEKPRPAPRDEAGGVPRRPRDPRLREDLGPEWFKEDGSLRWPDGKEPGALPNGFREEPYRDVLPPGATLDRYGGEGGNFLSPLGSPYSERALPYDPAKMPYHRYTVAKPLPVTAGRAAPWFGEPGGAVQYMTDMSIEDLIAEGYLVGGTR
ncbi:TNT domain-containing protein [Methylosinus sp. Ce-a6]|uniref:TNT domain-containing protein n=1 Tax=Methylosinus sp. Ce-a6 TaxID=2172005 RepID=UPI00135794AA|nr:TNT domain-containing protein [Methylosinus sp. Ce-a6]